MTQIKTQIKKYKTIYLRLKIRIIIIISKIKTTKPCRMKLKEETNIFQILVRRWTEVVHLLRSPKYLHTMITHLIIMIMIMNMTDKIVHVITINNQTSVYRTKHLMLRFVKTEWHCFLRKNIHQTRYLIILNLQI